MAIDIGKKLKTLRELNNLTQEELARKTGYARATLSHYELGNRLPDIETLIDICNVYNITLETFFKEDVETPTLKTKNKTIISTILTSIVAIVLIIIFSASLVTPKINYDYDIHNDELKVYNSDEIAIVKFLHKEDKKTYHIEVIESLKGDNFEFITINNKDIKIDTNLHYLVFGNKISYGKEMKNYLSLDCIAIDHPLFIYELKDYDNINYLNDSSNSSHLIKYYQNYINDEPKEDVIISKLLTPRKEEFIIDSKNIFDNPYDEFSLNEDFGCDVPTMLDNYYQYADIEISMNVKIAKGNRYSVYIYSSNSNEEYYYINELSFNVNDINNNFTKLYFNFKNIKLSEFKLLDSEYNLIIRYGNESLFNSSWINSDINYKKDSV